MGDGWGRERVAARANLRANVSITLRGRGSDVTERVRVLGASPRRRLIAVAAIGLVAVGVLAGCRSEPGTAAFIAGTRITDQQINDGVKTISIPNVGPGPVRQTYVADLAFIALAEHYAKDHQIDLPAVTNDELSQEAQSVGIPAGEATTNPVVRALTQSAKDLSTLIDKATPAKPTEAQLMEIYNRAKAAGLTTDTYAQDRATIAQIQGLGQAVAVQNEMAKATSTYGLEISPRYLPTPVSGKADNGLEIPVLQLQNQQTGAPTTVLGIPLGGPGASPAVIANPNAADSGTADANTP